MDELAKIVRVLKKMDVAYPHETLLVLDATVGRNALSQVAAFTATAGVTGVVMTKLDGTARGGVLIPVAEASRAPIKLIGVGEGIEDLQAFDARAFAARLSASTRRGNKPPMTLTPKQRSTLRMVIDYSGPPPSWSAFSPPTTSRPPLGAWWRSRRWPSSATSCWSGAWRPCR